jgi:hypothetical protein
MLTKITHLEMLGGFRLRVRFNDGSEGVHDFKMMVDDPGPMVEPLRNDAYFAHVFLEFGAPLGPMALTSPRNGCGVRWPRRVNCWSEPHEHRAARR